MILIDATSIRDRITGIERYTLELSWRIAKLAKSDGVETILALPENSIYPKDRTPLFDRVFNSPFKSRILTEQLWLPGLLGRLKPQSAFYPAFPPGLLSLIYKNNIKFCHTIHDAVMWKHKDTLSLKNKLYMRPMENLWISNYSTIETVSNFSKSEISEVFPHINNRIHASGNGLTALTNGNLERIIQERYILFVGTIEPRKNLTFLVQILKQVISKDPSLVLVIAGRPGWGIDELRSAIEKFSLNSHVRILGAVSELELASLYRHAEVFAYPSLYEGFGLPVLEAMNAGLPVISSDGGALPEAVGHGGLLISLDRPSEWVSSILEVANDRDFRTELIKRGQEHANMFSWDAVAERIYSRLKK